LNNDEWVKSQDPELIDALGECENLFHSLAQQLYRFIDCFEQYAHALEVSVRVPMSDLSSDSEVSPQPTQTFEGVAHA
jgi:hypothetical protein